MPPNEFRTAGFCRYCARSRISTTPKCPFATEEESEKLKPVIPNTDADARLSLSQDIPRCFLGRPAILSRRGYSSRLGSVVLVREYHEFQMTSFSAGLAHPPRRRSVFVISVDSSDPTALFRVDVYRESSPSQQPSLGAIQPRAKLEFGCHLIGPYVEICLDIR